MLFSLKSKLPGLPTIAASLLMVCASFSQAMEQQAFEQAMDGLPKGKASVASRLKALQDLRYRWIMESYPEAATFEGYRAVERNWSDVSAAGMARRKAQTRTLLTFSRQLDKGKLTPEQQLDYQLLYQDLLLEVKGFQFPQHLLPINHMSGIQRNIPSVLGAMAQANFEDYQTILARLEKLPTLVQQTQELMTTGLKQKLTPPQITLRDLPAQVRALIPSDAKQSPLLKTFYQMPTSISAAEQAALQRRAETLYRKALVPVWRELAEFIERQYIPGAVTDTAFTNMPDGMRWYAHRIRNETTTSLSAEEIHQLGLIEVERIRKEMESIIRKMEFDGDFKAFTEFLRTDPRFYHSSKQELMAHYRDIAKRIDGELPQLFGLLPRLPYGVKQIPSYAEKSQTTAYYMPGSIEAGRAGVFFANTYNLNSRPIWEMEALTVHEAMPGHHLQIALAQEQSNLHPLRRYNHYTAFVEGWGLYSESLGYDLGLYRDPYSEFGALTFDMWRAVRLVVDTGMHQLGWTRQQAIDYFAANSAKPLHDITVEIDRYLVWPGQALAYKIGQLRIKELRQRAEKALGSKFDIRAFHDQLLGAGSVPLTVLEARMNQWLKSQEQALAKQWVAS